MHHIFHWFVTTGNSFMYEENFSLTTISFLYFYTVSLKLLVVFLRG